MIEKPRSPRLRAILRACSRVNLFIVASKCKPLSASSPDKGERVSSHPLLAKAMPREQTRLLPLFRPFDACRRERARHFK
jgi:hypothetical protein